MDAPPQFLIERTVRVNRPSIDQGSQTSSSGEGRVFRFRLEQPAAGWLRGAVDQIETLTALPQAWDGYRSETIRASTAVRAVAFLLSTAYPELSPPSIVPLADGGIQVEWHRGGVDLEIAFSEQTPGVYIEDAETSESRELPLADAQAEVVRLAPRLAS